MYYLFWFFPIEGALFMLATAATRPRTSLFTNFVMLWAQGELKWKIELYRIQYSFWLNILQLTVLPNIAYSADE
jgi:hypothetical protein